MRNKNKQHHRNYSGSVLPIAVLLISALVPLTGLAVDISYFGILRGTLEKATEAASVAGAQEYFRNKADAGKAVNETVRAFKMNITKDTMTGNFQNSTGPGNPSTFTYSKTFTQNDNLSNVFRGSDVTITVMTDINRGRITVSSELIPKPLFVPFLANGAKINITRVAELPPFDVVLVVDLSGSMRFATVNSYIGSAYRQVIGMSGLGTLYTDVVLYQSQDENWRVNSTITANGYVTTISSITDVVINTPGTDIPTDASYSTGKSIYTNDPDRGFIVNSNNSTGLRRTALTGYRISELAGLNINAQDKQLAQTYADNAINSANFTTYFNRAAAYIEPQVSAVYGVMAFIDTVKMYGAAALKLGLVTFESNSYTNDRSSSWTCTELRSTNTSKRMDRILPYVKLIDPVDYHTIVDNLTIKSTGGNGLLTSPMMVYSYPNGGTNINAGLDNAKSTLDRSDRSSSAEKIIILFTDGEPTHTFSALGTKVKSLTDAGVKIYSIVLTLAVTQSTIDQFKYQMETVGKAEPVIFINDPAKLKDAFLQIADDLGLKLVG